ncbi:MAG: tetratricopeptide repeat protein [Treponema sp.]|jgi:tetratricopeptide (TPR) repeat protein|nr:tetratricopeptide repeat protein [Treponema sp.]
MKGFFGTPPAGPGFFSGLFRGLLLLLFLRSPVPAAAQQRAGALQEYRRGNYEEAVRICKAEIAATPNNLESHVVLCWSLVSLGRYEEGRTYALAGRTISRYDPRIIESLGEVYYFQGRNDEALQYFQEYVNLAPQGARINMVYYYIGEIFIRQGQFRRADIALSTAVYYMPANAEWWFRLAYARENAGEIREAVNAYEKALSLNSQLADARRGLERVRANLSDR